MVFMAFNDSTDDNILIDLEIGTDVVPGENRASDEAVPIVSTSGELLRVVPSGYVPVGLSLLGRDQSSVSRTCLKRCLECPLEENAKAGKTACPNKKNAPEKFKKGCKKPPKPPRPPQALPLDAVDQRLVREISEIAMLKRARIERMKALKKMKNAKQASSGGNIWAMVVTIIFCMVLIWQGVGSKGALPNRSFDGAPESASVSSRSSLISVHFYGNGSREIRNSLASASPGNVEQITGNNALGGANSVSRLSR